MGSRENGDLISQYVMPDDGPDFIPNNLYQKTWGEQEDYKPSSHFNKGTVFSFTDNHVQKLQSASNSDQASEIIGYYVHFKTGRTDGPGDIYVRFTPEEIGSMLDGKAFSITVNGDSTTVTSSRKFTS